MERKKTLKDRIGILRKFNQRFVLPKLAALLDKLALVMTIAGGVLLFVCLLIAPVLDAAIYYDAVLIGMGLCVGGLLIAMGRAEIKANRKAGGD